MTVPEQQEYGTEGGGRTLPNDARGPAGAAYYRGRGTT